MSQSDTAPSAAAGLPGRDSEQPLIAHVAFYFGVAVSLLHIWLNTTANLSELTHNALHWGSFGFLCALLFPMSKRGPQRLILLIDIALGIMAIACALYVIVMFDPLYARGVRFIATDWLFAITAVILALEFARRTAGLIIPALVVLGLAYVWFLGQYVPGVFRFPGLSLETVLFRAYFEVAGMFGAIARISATFVFMFILMGAFLVRSGAGDFVIDLAKVLAGRLVGGPGFVAVLGSALTGTISGSAVANTASTGVITIPLMQRAGFPGTFAAGVEAAASTGGQIMPPIMGAGAFVMANITGIPYTTIIAVSALPALLYFLSVAFWVRIEAKKHRLGISAEAPPSFVSLMKRGGITFLAPITVLIVMLMQGYTPVFAAVGGIAAVIVSSWLTPRPMGPRAILEALALGARNMTVMAVLLVAIGLFVMAVEATGVGNTLSLLLTQWAGGNLFVAIVLVALASLVLGMGLPVTAAYIVLGTLSAPALAEMINLGAVIDRIADGTLPDAARAFVMLGAPEAAASLGQPMPRADAAAIFWQAVDSLGGAGPIIDNAGLSTALLTTSLLSAHMIVFWLSQDSNVTPPVCLAAFTAATIAQTPPMRTGLAAWRVAKGLYIVPVLFAYTPFLSGEPMVALRVFVFAVLGIYALTAALAGHAETPLPLVLRLAFAALGIALLWPLAVALKLGLGALFLALFAWSLRRAGPRPALSPTGP